MKGSIETTIEFNDQAKTEKGFERFRTRGFDVTIDLLHPLTKTYIDVSLPTEEYDEMSVMVCADGSVSFNHESGGFSATPKEIEDALWLLRSERRKHKLLSK